MEKIIKLIPQNIYILDDTIIKNVAFDTTVKTLILKKKDALKKANAYEFVYSLKNNLSTNCGELGEFLSGGQSKELQSQERFITIRKFSFLMSSQIFLMKKKKMKL